MPDFAHEVEYDTTPDEEFEATTKLLNEITEQAAIGHDILSELEGAASPTIKALMTEAKDAYVLAIQTIVEINPFESEQEKARFIRVQSDARRYREMLEWLRKWIEPFHRYQERIAGDEKIEQMRREREHGRQAE